MPNTQDPSTATPHTDGATANTWVWSIADVERETGLGKDTLRVWERRYGFPSPQRGTKQVRLYSTEQLAQLRLIKNLMDNGARPHQVVGLPLSELQTQCAALLQPVQNRPDGAQPETAHDDVSEPCLQALEQGQTTQLKQLLQQQLLRHGLAHTIEHHISPLCVAVGHAWVQGRVSVYHEHLFTELVQSLLREAIASTAQHDQLLGRHLSGPKVLLTTTPGEPHQLGLLMAECFFALEGCERLMLGPCTPVADIALAAQQLKADVVALSFTIYSVRKDVLASLSQLRQMLPANIQIWVGGGAPALRRKGLPPGIVVLDRASAIADAVARWSPTV
jgi:MerR family transcriptional regulator, light-induced transcriptional regulator